MGSEAMHCVRNLTYSAINFNAALQDGQRVEDGRNVVLFYALGRKN